MFQYLFASSNEIRRWKKKFEAFSGAHAYYNRRRGARGALRDVIALAKVSTTVRSNRRLSVVAEKKKENVEHPVGTSCQRTGYSLRRLSNIASKGGDISLVFKGWLRNHRIS